jgi:hypothetical protein
MALQAFMCYIFEKWKDNTKVDIKTSGWTVSSELASDSCP